MRNAPQGAGGTEVLKGFPNGIVKSRANLANHLALPIGPCSVGKQRNCHPSIKIDP
jgi:hypothetical protein